MTIISSELTIFADIFLQIYITLLLLLFIGFSFELSYQTFGLFGTTHTFVM